MRQTLLPLLSLLSSATLSTAVAVPSPTAAADSSTTQRPGGKVDYVIVGGGPAGFVVAEQLSRNPRVRVTLLEAGPDASQDPVINVPAYFIEVLPYLSLYDSQPDPNLGGLTPNLWQGKVLGGGSATNGMLYCRGSSSVFDEWARISGNPGLAWNSLLNDFRATSHYTFQPADYQQIVNTNGFGNGPLEVSRTSGLTGFDLPFATALQSTLGLKEQDFTDGTGIGYDLGLGTIRVSNRTRSYALNTFGYEMANRPNFRLIHNAMVQKIGFSGRTAQSVTYINTLNNQTSTLTANEVIVAGGAINTPKLLMLSGVGPRNQLTKFNIPVVADIPDVGANLYDHHYSAIEVEVTPNVETVWQWSVNATGVAEYQAEYARDRSGPLGWNNGDLYAGYRLPDSIFQGINSTYYTSLPKDRPNVFFEYSTAAFVQPAPNVSIVTAWSTVIQPEASGYLTLASANYEDAPLIYSNYYGSEADKAVIMNGYKQLRSVLQAAPLQSTIVREVFPGANVTTDAQIWQAIQQSAASFHHPVGTVALGKVLDANWRIKGLKGIRVVDSSAIPNLPTCHPQSDVYAVAHRAALDIIRADGVGQ
ncbi:MAG: hypothetical protein Q9225_004082 [Loekoesia sp. 1 TL-2023]